MCNKSRNKSEKHYINGIKFSFVNRISAGTEGQRRFKTLNMKPCAFWTEIKVKIIFNLYFRENLIFSNKLNFERNADVHESCFLSKVWDY